MPEPSRSTPTQPLDRWMRRRPALLILACGLVVLSLLGWLFAETTEAVLEQDDIAAVDDPLTRWLVQQRQPWLTAAMRTVTRLGDAWFVVTMIVVVTVVLGARRRPWSELVVLPIASGGAAIIVTFIKVVIERPRPTIGEIVATASGFAFPSGHSAQAVACYGALAWLIAHVTATRRATVLAWSGAAVVAFPHRRLPPVPGCALAVGRDRWVGARRGVVDGDVVGRCRPAALDRRGIVDTRGSGSPHRLTSSGLRLESVRRRLRSGHTVHRSVAVTMCLYCLDGQVSGACCVRRRRTLGPGQ